MVTFYKYWNINPKRELIREAIAEFLGTFFLVFLGNNAVAQKVFTGGEGGSNGTIYLGYALAAFIGVLVSAGVSGAHLNPAVTVAGAVVKKVDWIKVPHYLIAQYLGGFVGACGTYLLYIDYFEDFHQMYGANQTTAGIFATYPREGLSVFGGFVDQIFGTMVLVIAVYAIMDKKNTNVPLQLVPLYVALVIVSIGCSIAVNEGFAINPARDLAPRFFTYITFWGDQVFSNKSFWYIPIIAPHIGAILGAGIYVLFIERLRDISSGAEETNKEFDIEIVEKKIFQETPAAPSPKKEKKGFETALYAEKYTCRL